MSTFLERWKEIETKLAGEDRVFAFLEGVAAGLDSVHRQQRPAAAATLPHPLIAHLAEALAVGKQALEQSAEALRSSVGRGKEARRALESAQSLARLIDQLQPLLVTPVPAPPVEEASHAG